ncbi:hypothetical protein [Streptomyces sp. NRRL F-5065]|uniref:hypothetical protein n=1 Tax=Streptomyces sp. NRRL F-5065 TaxID=1463855 RepID=UPI00131AED85|nr:hypothetical protein [Streptomyces sp. NRRL F-5065]
MTTDLGALVAAADSWDDMAKELRKQEKAYKRDVHGISMGPSWLGISSEAAGRRFGVTLEEYRSAQTEAKAMAAILREGHSSLAGVRENLKSVRQEASGAKMRVSAQGVVLCDSVQLTEGEKNALRHDPEYQETVRKAVASWQSRIDETVELARQADEALATAIGAVVIDNNALDGTLNGFNGQAVGSIGPYEEAAQREEAERKKEARRKAEYQKQRDDALETALRGLARAADELKGPDDLKVKLLNAAIEGVAEVTGYNNTRGVTLAVGVGWGGAGAEYSITLAETTTPDGKTQFGVLPARSFSSAGLDLGFSAKVGTFKSNADDISQLEGTGLDKGVSYKAGVGLYGGYQEAVGTKNSKGEDVNSVSWGIGAGLGAELSGGYSEAETWWRTEVGKGE